MKSKKTSRRNRTGQSSSTSTSEAADDSDILAKWRSLDKPKRTAARSTLELLRLWGKPDTEYWRLAANRRTKELIAMGLMVYAGREHRPAVDERMVMVPVFKFVEAKK